MATCETCGNTYDKAFTITLAGSDSGHVFDSFECAIHAIAPTCEDCGVRIVGHGVESDDSIFCCAHCAERSGKGGVADRAQRV